MNPSPGGRAADPACTERPLPPLPPSLRPGPIVVYWAQA